MRTALKRSAEEAAAKAAAKETSEQAVLEKGVNDLLSSASVDLETITLRFVRDKMMETCDFETKPYKKYIKSLVTGFIDGAVAKKQKEVAQKNKRAAKRRAAAASAKKVKSASKKRKRASSSKKADDAAPKAKRVVNHPTKPLSKALAAVVGADVMSRPHVVKNIWVYIRANGLQDPTDKRRILCDAKLRAVMGGEATVTMFSLNKYLSPHFL